MALVMENKGAKVCTLMAMARMGHEDLGKIQPDDLRSFI